MKRFTTLDGYIDDQYKAKKEEYLEQHPGTRLTRDAGEQINAQLMELLNKEILEDKPTVNPKRFLDLYKPSFPNIRLTTPQERITRKEKRERAARAYAQGLLTLHGYSAQALDYYRYRHDYRVARALNPEDLKVFNELQSKLSPPSDAGKNEKPEGMPENVVAADPEKDKKQEEDTKARYSFYYKALRNTVEEYGDILSCEMTDEQLIDAYPKIANAASLILEGHQLLEEARKNKYLDVPPEELEKLDREVLSLMSYVTPLNRKIALLADPNYPYFTMEELQRADPGNQMHYRDRTDGAMVEPEDEAGIDVYNPKAGPKRVITTLSQEQQRKEGEELPYQVEEVPQLQAEGPQPQPDEDGYSNRMPETDNTRELANRALEDNAVVWLQRIADELGITLEELKKNGTLCGRSGKTEPVDEETLYNMLKENNGEVYVMSRKGNGAIVPVLLDPTGDAFTLRVGSRVIAALPSVAEPKKPSIGWMSSAVNGMVERWFGPTEAMKKYRAAEKKYQEILHFRKNKEEVAAKRIPKTVWRRNQNIQIKANQKTYQRRVESDLVLLRSPGVADQQPRFDKVLGDLVAAKAFASPADSAFRKTMMGILGVYDQGFDENNAFLRFRESNTVREFAQRLRREHGEYLVDLGSEEPGRRNHALTEICELFRVYHKEDEALALRNEKTGVYAQQIAERKKASDEKKAVPVGKLFSREDLECMEQHRGNRDYWDNVLSLFGPTRRLRPDWISVCGGHGVYRMEHWQKMQQSEVLPEELRPEGKDLDEKTFAALSMVLSQRRMEEMTPEKMKSSEWGTLSMTFEDVFSTVAGPRDCTATAIEPIFEPSRTGLLAYLKGMDRDEGPQGKQALAGELAKKLHLLACRCSTLKMNDRKHVAMAEICIRTMDFVKAHGMEQMIREKGLSKEDWESLQITCAVGKIAGEGFDAEDQLLSGYEDLELKQRRELLDKVMLLRAVQVDLRSHEQKADYAKSMEEQMARRQKELDKLRQLKAKGYITSREFTARENKITEEVSNMSHSVWEDFRAEYSPVIRDLLQKGEKLKKLSYLMMPEEKRDRVTRVQGGLLEDGKLRIAAGEVNEELRGRNGRAMMDKWEKLLKKEQECMPKLEARVAELEELAKQNDKKAEALAKAIRPILKDGSLESKLAMAGMTDEELLGPETKKTVETYRKQKAQQVKADEEPELQKEPQANLQGAVPMV